MYSLSHPANSQHRSEYRQEYQEHEAAVSGPIGDRKSHFTIASDEPNMANNNYLSEFKQQYSQYPPQQTSPPQRLGDNNIVLGF
jgi:hypothetical protein